MQIILLMLFVLMMQNKAVFDPVDLKMTLSSCVFLLDLSKRNHNFKKNIPLNRYVQWVRIVFLLLLLLVTDGFSNYLN